MKEQLEFNDIASQWFQDIANKSSDEVKLNSIEDYKQIREALFKAINA